MTFTNCYEDTTRAEAYARLEFANTYHLAFRDLPDIIREHATGTRGLFAQCGDAVRIVTTDFADSRPIVDILCTDECYRQSYARANLEVVAVHKPLATGSEPYAWVTETAIAPWVIYVLKGR